MKRGVDRAEILRVAPGLLLAASVGTASILLSDAIGRGLFGFDRSPVSSVMVALILGIVIGNVVRLPALCEIGVQFAGKRVLRLGIVLLGIRLSVGQVARLGAVGVPIVIGCVAAALLFVSLLTRWMHLPAKLGALIAVGTSICGVSAIVATAPAIEADDEEVAYAVSVITIFGLVATLLYPIIAHRLFGDAPTLAGLFLGTAIHDTSQVTGAGLVYSELYRAPEALSAATVAKLVRNLFMGMVIPLVAIMYRRTHGVDRRDGSPSARRISISIVPLFIVGFVALAGIRTIGDLMLQNGNRALGIADSEAWSQVIALVKTVAVYCLVAALAAVGMRIRVRKLAHLGFKPFIAGLGAALAVGGVSIGLVLLLGPRVAVG